MVVDVDVNGWKPCDYDNQPSYPAFIHTPAAFVSPSTVLHCDLTFPADRAGIKQIGPIAPNWTPRIRLELSTLSCTTLKVLQRIYWASLLLREVLPAGVTFRCHI